MRVKICGIRKPDQGRAIAQLGATALGFICVAQSPRYVTPAEIRTVVDALPMNGAGMPTVDRVGVFVDAAIETIQKAVEEGKLNGVQLHGRESLDFCQKLRKVLPGVEIIKAFRIRTLATLLDIPTFQDDVDSFLLDAYHPHLMGGTGKTLNWTDIQAFRSDRPWFLAGGLTPDNVSAAITLLHPNGLDLSSGVEVSPGDKDLIKVKALFHAISGVAQTVQGWNTAL